MHDRPTDVLVLAIDAASPDLLERWAADGTLPHLGALMQRGLCGRTRNLDGFVIGATWPTLVTGVSPARHGIHYTVQIRPGSHAFYRPSDEAEAYLRHPPFWTWLARQGRRVALLDVPLTRIDRSMDALQIIEWGGHDALFGFHTWPAAREQDIRQRFGLHAAGTSCDAITRDVDGYRRFVEALIEGIRTRTALTLDVLREGSRDFVMQVFTESHCVGHQCWHLHDLSHPAHDAGTARVIGDPLRRVYSAIDAAIGELLAGAPGARVVVLSAHGMAHTFGAAFLLRDLLLALGATHTLPPAAAERRSTIERVLRRAWRGLPAGVRRGLSPLRAQLQPARAALDPLAGLDLTRSTCFPVPNGLAAGGIRLNLAGREPAGALPVAEADAFCDRLGADLMAVTDERTGEPLVRRVLRTRDVYAGPHLDALPDLIVEWDDTAPTGSALLAGGAGARVRVRSPRIGTLEGENDFGRTGEHRAGGFFVAAGPGIANGRLEGMASILDYAPTFAAMLGLGLPGAEGSVIPGLARTV